MTIYFVAGEVSADNHGAALMRSLRDLDPNLEFIGRGGPQMRQTAGTLFKDWIGEAAVLGLWEVLRKYGYFREQFGHTIREIVDSRPDAVVLIDYPGFNLRLARALRRRSKQQKIIYYISPQVWAWNRGRIKRMARFIDLVLRCAGRIQGTSAKLYSAIRSGRSSIVFSTLELNPSSIWRGSP